MPVSVVCESSASVNAALRESLGSSYSSAAGNDDGKAGGGGASVMSSGGGSSDECLQSKLVASAKRVLLSKIEYEEVSNYGQSVLDSLKSKYIVLKPGTAVNGDGIVNAENGQSSPATGSNSSSNNNNNGGINGSTADPNGSSGNITNYNNNNTSKRSTNICNNNNNPNELPQPKRILYPRENIRIGWKNSPRKWQVGVGMMNVGNTCYLNSTLQALFHVPSLANWLMCDSQHMEHCDSADAGCIICAMAKTLLASQNSQSAIRPYFVYSKLKSICKHLVMGRQEDAHEFLRYLVEAMEKSYLSRFRSFKELDQHSKETTPLNQILGGYLKSAVRCLSCGHVSVTFQHFQDLMLDIRKADTVEEAMDGYFSRERLEDMGYKCESCKKKVSATKQFSLERAPIALCIQLKRFSMIGTKLNKQITIKPRLDLTKFASRKNTGEQLTYKLVAMVTHLGASQHCGHYTAIGLTESGTYYNYDDSFVRPISVQNVCNTNAYIIFYELDSTPPRQVSGTGDSKENYQKMNGYSLGVSAGNNGIAAGSPRIVRIAGPQLPPGYNNPNNKSSAAPLINGSSYTNGNNCKLSINRQSGIPTSTTNNNCTNSKIMILFKNGNGTTTKSSATTATAMSTSQTQNGNGGYKNNSNGTQLQNGLLVGTGKFQESTHSKPSLVGSPNKGQSAAISNGNENSRNSSTSSDHDEDEVNSSSQLNRKVSSTNTSSASSTVVTPKAAATLPSMPKLFDNGSSTTVSSSVSKKTNTCSSTLPVVKSSVKSLVPYESETDDEYMSTGETKHAKCNSNNSKITEMTNGKNILKRPNSSTTSSDDNDDDANVKLTNGIKVKKTAATAASTSNIAGNTTLTSSSSQNGSANGSSSFITQSKANKQKTDVIDDIFNLNKRNANSYSSSSNNTPTATTSKKQKPHQFNVSSTTPKPETNDDDESGDDSKRSRPPFKRSHSTPPSPPVIKTKTGLWQVTALKPDAAEQQEKYAITVSKNPKNPFATKSTIDLFAKRSKFKAENSEKQRTFAGNGYLRDSASDSAVSELLKQSHRGYGAPVLTWTGSQTEIEKEIADESREMRQREWEEEDDNEMDRGRQKKVVRKDANAHANSNLRTPGYNPFQEHQEQQRRWKHGGGGAHRFYGGSGHFRHHFQQRNKYKFQRFNHKFQRSSTAHQQRNNGGGGGGYQRRDS